MQYRALSRQALHEAVLDLSRRREHSTGGSRTLAEDLRLLFCVALPVQWHCSLVAPLVRRRSDKKGETDVHQSALGRPAKGEPMDAGPSRLY